MSTLLAVAAAVGLVSYLEPNTSHCDTESSKKLDTSAWSRENYSKY